MNLGTERVAERGRTGLVNIWDPPFRHLCRRAGCDLVEHGAAFVTPGPIAPRVRASISNDVSSSDAAPERTNPARFARSLGQHRGLSGSSVQQGRHQNRAFEKEAAR